MTVLVGSLNPGKVQPVREVFGTLFPALEVSGAAVPSGVRDQPIGVGETRRARFTAPGGLPGCPARPGAWAWKVGCGSSGGAAGCSGWWPPRAPGTACS
ncbi:hypothetical protein GCM10008019_35030 [Deinococcus soli (ex Cha et al. 2016)]|nr:hypothetical protein GCM10008019_35030 [Deinococcus soli (ex Cha et al. 2016)]